MSVKQLITHDNLDDRREAFTLLSHLPPQRRIAFLRSCLAKSAYGNASDVRLNPNAYTLDLADKARWDDECSERLTREIYHDLWNLANQWQLDLDWALSELVRFVRPCTSAS